MMRAKVCELDDMRVFKFGNRNRERHYSNSDRSTVISRHFTWP